MINALFRKVMKSKYLRYDLRELLAISFALKSTKSKSQPLFAVVFFFILLVYSISLKKLPISYKNNIFETHTDRRFGILNLDKICQNTLIIDQKRLARRRADYKAIYNNLHCKLAKGMVVKQLKYEQIPIELSKVLMANSRELTISSKFYGMDRERIAGFSVYDLEGNLVATSAGFFTNDIFNIEFFLSVYGENSLVARWVLHEAIVDFVHARGYKYLRISNYLTTSIKNIYFNRRLGYVDYNFK